MNESLVEEAESWLIQLHKDLYSDPGLEKEPEVLYDEVAWEVSLLCPELLEAVKTVLAKWLSSNNAELITNALPLISRLKATEFIPLIDKVQKGLSADPAAHKFFVMLVRDTLNALIKDAESG